jgi:hypothetical protein
MSEHKQVLNWSDIGRRLGIEPNWLLADVAAKIGNRPIHAVYIGGSLAEGYGNVRSDVDVYVLVDEISRPLWTGGFELSIVNSHALQYAFVSVEQLDAAILQFENRSFEEASVSRALNQILHRLVHSVVVHGDVIVQRYRSRLNAARYSAFSSFVKEMQCENSLVDAYGAWETGQYETATYNLRLAAIRAFEAVLSLYGQTATNEKWVFEKAALALGKKHPAYEGFVELYRRMPISFSSKDVKEYFDDLLAFVQFCFDATTGNVLMPHSPYEQVSNLTQAILKRKFFGLRQKNSRIHIKRYKNSNLVCQAAIPKRELSDRAALVWLWLGVASTLVESVEMARDSRPDLFVDVSNVELAKKLEAAWLKTGMLVG